MAGIVISTHKNIENGVRMKVVNRTRRQHKDYANNRFISYTIAYAKKKKVAPKDVNLFLTGEMLKNFYVEVKPSYYKLNMDGLDLPFDSIDISYGFKTLEARNKYYWNASNTRHKKHRDFLGIANNSWLMPEIELRRMIIELSELGY